MTREELTHLEWKHNVLNRLTPTIPMESVTIVSSSSFYVYADDFKPETDNFWDKVGKPITNYT